MAPKKQEPLDTMDAHLVQIFNKYAEQEPGRFLNKTEFKCAFIFVFGVKPSKDDILMCKEYIKQTTHYQGAAETVPFELGQDGFVHIMKAFSEVIEVPSGGPLQQFLHKKAAFPK